jgi:hypothetical protein
MKICRKEYNRKYDRKCNRENNERPMKGYK